MSSTYIHGFSASEQARLLALADALASVVFGGLIWPMRTPAGSGLRVGRKPASC